MKSEFILPNVGDRIVVYGNMYAIATVSSIEENVDKISWIIRLQWENYGSSYVYSYDENHIWYRYSNTN